MLQLAAKLAARLARGEVMYLHCWGGHGRTGTVVCIMLHLMYGLSADEAMERCQHVHDVRRIPISVGSPQTDAQREQVRRVIGHVVAHRQSLPPSPPPPQRQRQPLPSAAAASASSGDGSRKSGGFGGGGGARKAGAAAAAVGGRRAWVRGRRQAFAPAPNGVGEDVSGWLPGDDDDDGGAEEGLEGRQGGGGLGKGKRQSCGELASRTASSGALAATEAGAGAGADSSVTMPRRKSFTEPYSEEDPSRGTRMLRLRRKSAPGKPPADVLAARSAASAAAAAASGKEDCCAGGSLSLSPPANRKSRRHSKTCAATGVDASPGSCTGVERCLTRSTGGGGGGAGMGLSPSRCVTR